MILTTQCTYDYYLKMQPLFDSIKKYWPHRFVLGCIGFNPAGYTGERFTVRKCDVPSYRVDYPKNRPGFVTMQNGDFARYIKSEYDEPIICIDGDTILQREMTTFEHNIIHHGLLDNFLLSVYHSNPPVTLQESIINMGAKNGCVALLGNDTAHRPEFTTSFLVSRRNSFISISEVYNRAFNRLPAITDHHAGNQWLFNIVASNYNIGILPNNYQCGNWYGGFTEEDAKKAIFNHTKFN